MTWDYFSSPPLPLSALSSAILCCAVLCCSWEAAPDPPPGPWLGLQHIGKVRQSLVAVPKRGGEQRLTQTWLLVSNATSKPSSSATAGMCRGRQRGKEPPVRDWSRWDLCLCLLQAARIRKGHFLAHWDFPAAAGLQGWCRCSCSNRCPGKSRQAAQDCLKPNSSSRSSL